MASPARQARRAATPCSGTPLEESARRSAFRRRLLAWYDQHRRDLPWRNPSGHRQRDLYRVWISEVMLQQTQVQTVLPYYRRFVTQFPTVAGLAQAPLPAVLRAWEGLGYYRRARQLHAAARQIVAEHGGRFPTDLPAVLALPGIGRYTAAAILSIADNQPLPVLEGNTQRLYARLIAYPGDPRSATGRRDLWSVADQLVSQSRPGDLNQALMELGSQQCTVEAPDCPTCPVRAYCAAHQSGQQDRYPVPSGKAAYESVWEAAVAIARRRRLLMRRCRQGERWAGLWDFPRYTVEPEETPASIAGRVRRHTGLHVTWSADPLRIKHGVTRYRISLTALRARTVHGRLLRGSGLVWIDETALRDLPLCSTGREIARWVTNRSHQKEKRKP